MAVAAIPVVKILRLTSSTMASLPKSAPAAYRLLAPGGPVKAERQSCAPRETRDMRPDVISSRECIRSDDHRLENSSEMRTPKNKSLVCLAIVAMPTAFLLWPAHAAETA